MEKTHILFILPDLGGFTISFSPAIQILSAFLKSHNIQVSLLHLYEYKSARIDFMPVLKKVKELKPHIIGFSVITNHFILSNNCAHYLKQGGVNVPIIIGGIHAIICPEDLKNSYFDGFCIGEGEFPLLELCKRIEKKQEIYTTPGFTFKKQNRIIKNPPGKVIEDLDILPPRDFEIMNSEHILNQRNNWLSISFSRGCTYGCSFCINHKLRKIFEKSQCMNYFRVHSIDRIITELQTLVQKYKKLIKIINFDDDLLMIKKPWFLQLLSSYKENIYKQYNIKFAINGRANLIDEEIVKALKESGCELTRVGFETGSEKLRNKILLKSLKDRDLINAFSLFRKYEIRSCALAMIGIPGENKESIQTTLAMIRELKPDLIRLPFFEPFRGTVLYEYCKKNRLIKDYNETDVNLFIKPFIKFQDIKEKEVILYQKLFPWFLNWEFVPVQYADKYKELINGYKTFSGSKLITDDCFDKILAANTKITKELKMNKIDHFTYYNKNKMYFEFVHFSRD